MTSVIVIAKYIEAIMVFNRRVGNELLTGMIFLMSSNEVMLRVSMHNEQEDLVE